MLEHRFKAWSLVLGLAVWAVVLWTQTNPAANLPSELRASVPERTAIAGTMQSPAQLYETSCASCHQGKGEGRFPVFPPLAGSPWVNGDPDRLVALTLHGLSGPIDVNGVDYSGLMPGFAHLSDREMAQVLSHVRSTWGNEAARITEADVADIRKRTSDRRIPWTAAELQRAGGQ